MRSEPKEVPTVLWHWFALLAPVHPGSFHAFFGDEPETVFVRRLVAARQHGWVAVLRLCLREFSGLSVAILVEWWVLWQER